MGADVTSKAAKARPLYLDYYDNLSFKSYVHPMKTAKNYSLEQRWPFMKKFGIAGLAFYGATWHERNPAPNVFDWIVSDYEVHEAEQAGGLVEPKPWLAQAPLWEYNAQPDRMMKVSDTTLVGSWGSVGEAGGHYPTRSDSVGHPGLLFMRQQMERYNASPAIGGWHLMIGAPGAEYGISHDRATSSWDHSAPGQACWPRVSHRS